jgi:hypothetical protein
MPPQQMPQPAPGLEEEVESEIPGVPPELLNRLNVEASPVLQR